MLHGHVVTLLDHRVLIRDVSSGADIHVSTRLVDITVLTLVLEAALASVEDHCILEMFVPRLAEGARSALTVGSSNLEFVIVLSGSWDLKLQTLSVEDLIRIKARRGAVEANLLAREGFIISCSHLLGPLRTLI